MHRVPPLFALFALLPAFLQAQAPQERPRPRVAVALSGGGARGIAHIGALRALEEAGIPVDAIAANSMGAIVGGIYATGRNAREMEEIVRSLDWAGLFSGRPDRRVLPVARHVDRYAPVAGLSFDRKGLRLPGGLLADHRVNRFLIESLSAAGYAAGGDFDALPIRFRAVATDLATGEPVVLASGDLARAVRASMSIPLVFPPVDWSGRKLVDGLVVNNLPCDIAKSLDPLVLVSVDIGSPPLDPDEYESALGVASQINNLLTERRNRDFQLPADVAIRPDLGKHSTTDYSGFDELIGKAYEATKAALPAIRERLQAAGADLAPRQGPAAGPSLANARIAEVTVEGNERVSDALVRRIFNVPVGPGWDMTRGLRAFDKIDATGLVDRTWLEFAPADEGAVRVKLLAKDAPPFRAEVGVGFSEWERARGSLRLRNGNSLGFGERTELLVAASDAESRGSLSLAGERLVLAGLGHRVTAQLVTDKPRFFDSEGSEINRARFERRTVEGALRSSFERWGLVEAGLRFGRVDTKPQAGLEAIVAEERRDQVGAAFASFTIDTLDALEWPDFGSRLVLRAEWSPAGLGADREYWLVAAEGRIARKAGPRGTLQVDAQAGLSGDDLPVYDWYRLGGATLVPGYHAEELKGAQYFAGAASYRYRLFGQLRLLARVGAGNVFATTGDIGFEDLRWGVAAGVYHPTPLGPVALEAAVRDGGGTLVSLAVGWN